MRAKALLAIHLRREVIKVRLAFGRSRLRRGLTQMCSGLFICRLTFFLWVSPQNSPEIPSVSAGEPRALLVERDAGDGENTLYFLSVSASFVVCGHQGFGVRIHAWCWPEFG